VKSSFILMTVQPRAGLRQRLLGAARVGELTLRIVVENEQTQPRSVLVLSEVEHRKIAVSIPTGKKRPTAETAPDLDRLLRPIVEEAELCLRVMVPPWSSLAYSSAEPLPITRSGGIPNTSWAIERMKSPSLPETM
jgi:hypothetical protein